MGFIRKFSTMKIWSHVTWFAKTRHNDALSDIQDFCISEFHVSKAFFCSNINAVLQILFKLRTWLDSKRCNILALYTFLRRLTLQVFNYTIITYRYFNIRSWDKDYSTQHEMVILITYKFLQRNKNRKANYRKRAIVLKCLNNYHFSILVNKHWYYS